MNKFSRTLAFIFSLSSLFAGAQQLTGGEISYKCQSGSTYTISVSLYAKCPNPSLPVNVSVSYYSPSENGNPLGAALTKLGTDQTIAACVGQLNKCDGGINDETADAIIKRTYTGTIVLPSTRNDWTVEIVQGPRAKLNALDAQVQYMLLSAVINNTAPTCNSSPSFNSNPPLFSSAGQQVTYNPNLVDPDGDKLTFALVKPRYGNSSVSYVAPYSETQPIATNGAFRFDANTGTMIYIPSNQGDQSVTAVQVTQKRNGVVVGSTTREMYFQTMKTQTSPPFFVGPDTLKFCNSGPITISYTGATKQKGASPDIIWNNKADWTDVANVNPVITKGDTSVTFQLNANAFNTFTKQLDLTLVDNNCGNVRKILVVKVYPKPSVKLNVGNNISNDTTVTCIDKPISVRADVTGGLKPFNYQWINSNSKTNSISVSGKGIYTVIVTDANNCTSSDFLNVKIPIDFTFDRYCTDLTTRFYDISSIAGNTTIKRSLPLPTTKTWKWTFGDDNSTSSDTIGNHKFAKKGTYKVKLETSNGSSTCISSIEKDVFICGRPPVGFTIIDSCVNTERSDLKVIDIVRENGPCYIDSTKIKYYINGVFRTNVATNRYPTRMFIDKPGPYKVTLIAENQAGCRDTTSKTVNIRAKPTVTKSANDFFYRCDKGYPDTSFTFTGTTILTLADTSKGSKAQSLLVSRTGYSDTTLKTNSVGGITVPFIIKQNQQSVINFRVTDAFACTNDTSIVISDPITPSISLSKYYCFLNDTLKLQDATYYIKNGYTWGLKKATWNMKDSLQETTLGFANHAYSLASLNEAMVKLNVEDVTGCKDSDSIKVYLSKPDPSQFRIVAPLACFSDTVRIFGIQGKYINSWFYRYKSNPQAIYDTTDKYIYNPVTAFGKSFPAHLDTTQFYKSNKYQATTAIFYNEPDTTLNFIKDGFGQNIVPRIPTNVCHIAVTRVWRIVPRLHYGILDDYNHCFDSTKIIKAALSDTTAPNAILDTTSFTWSLYSPKKTLLNQLTLGKSSPLVYAPSNSFFKDTATTRSSSNTVSPNDPNTRVGDYLPYRLKVKYGYSSEGISCTDTASLWLANERVVAKIDRSPSVTCLNYTRSYYFKSPIFLENVNGIDEKAASIWYFGDDSVTVGSLPRRRYAKPGNYTVIANVTNQYGCRASDTFLLTVKPSPIARLTIDSVCLGKESILNGSGSTPSEPSSSITNYYWYFGNKIYKEPNPAIPGDTSQPYASLASRLSDTAVISNLFSASQNVGLVVRDSNGCYGETGLVLAKVNALPVASFTAKTVLYDDEDYLGNEAIKFDATTQNVTHWTWSMGNGQVLASPTGVSQYDINYTYPYYAPPNPPDKNIYSVTLRVRTDGGCIDSVTKKIDVNVYFVLPNAFSPNDDGLHDMLLGVGKGIREMKEFKIFNRWGEVVHSTTGKPEKDDTQRGYLLWDGKYNGVSQPVGAYVYYAVVKTGYGEELIFKGNLALLK